MNKREARKAINGYFGEVKHSIMFVDTKKGVLAYVEYEDFMPEHTVRRELERLLGVGYLVSVKRECSRSLFKEILDFLSSDTSGQKTLLMMMGNYVSAHPLHNSLWACQNKCSKPLERFAANHFRGCWRTIQKPVSEVFLSFKNGRSGR